VLRMAEANDYALAGVPADILTPSSPPGRGLLDGTEIQVAMLGDQPDVGAQAAAIRDFAAVLEKAQTVAARPIQRLTERVRLAELPATVGDQPVIGLSSETLGPLTFEPRGTMIIGGPPGSGRTTAMHAVAAALRRWDPAVDLHYFGNSGSTLTRLDLWTSVAAGALDATEHAAELVAKLDPEGPPVAVFVENIAEFHNGPADAALQDLVRLCLERSWLFVAEGETTTLGSGAHGLLGLAKLSRVGLALAPDSGDNIVYRTNFPTRLNRADFPPGRALFVALGRTTVVQVGLP
jgi:DNA segregation ATPase FtsK/SpoIIIE, S-DNA-T family